ncbi:MAG: YihA family ribosome biogenesis GTP-binding protein [Candidatus Eisenbacteria bacterium]|nr:YihA family ribosome biogenesis GTP-binding protein [Candidatus Eisenbacteria bacterium]
MGAVKPKTAEFMLGAARLDQLPRAGLPEIALAGRSNVGKSSLLNKLTGRRKLARISKTPGKTRELNLYEIDARLVLVDLPGYGYAKVGGAKKRRWGDLIEAYLSGREELRGIVHLVDARHEPSAQDVQMHEWIGYYDVPALIAATKADKIAKSKRERSLQAIRRVLEPAPGTPLILFSAVTGQGVDEVWKWIWATGGSR